MKRKMALALIVLFLAIQLVPVDRTNPPVQSDLKAPPAAAAVLRRACYDCHSNETRWPWYSRIAPVSWLVAYDVKQGRRELNFSVPGRQETDDILKVVRRGEMPPGIYLPAHPEARLTRADLAVLESWLGSAGGADHDD